MEKNKKRKYDIEYRKRNYDRIKNNRIKKRSKLSELEVEIRKSYYKDYYYKNKDKIKEYNRDYYIKNSDKIKKYVNKKRIEEPEKIAERKKKYYRTEQGKAVARNQKAKRRAVDHSNITSNYIYMLKCIAIGFGNRCPLCNHIVDGKNRVWWLEHSNPLCKKGLHSKDNIFYSCNVCNLKKGKMSLNEFIGISFDEFIHLHLCRKAQQIYLIRFVYIKV